MPLLSTRSHSANFNNHPSSSSSTVHRSSSHSYSKPTDTDTCNPYELVDQINRHHDLYLVLVFLDTLSTIATKSKYTILGKRIYRDPDYVIPINYRKYFNNNSTYSIRCTKTQTIQKDTTTTTNNEEGDDNERMIITF
ncbi:hypothetical protein H4Q26_005669 [Puccinia striiformis f. sp. tritici PST-130]|nr:hypothetical protein H4Q26_005669 [Puccinia striiformis f. sp. tritici PST-130]